MSFASLGLIDPIARTLETLEYKNPTPVQAQAIPAVLAGRDVMAAAQTGTGKTAGFALPLLQRLVMEGTPLASNTARALVLVPTRELAEQVHTSFQTYGASLPLRTMVAYGGVSINPQMMRLRKGVDLLVATPGRLLDLHRQNALKFNATQMLVLDEADRMLDLGFSRELDQVLAALPKKRCCSRPPSRTRSGPWPPSCWSIRSASKPRRATPPSRRSGSGRCRSIKSASRSCSCIC